MYKLFLVFALYISEEHPSQLYILDDSQVSPSPLPELLEKYNLQETLDDYKLSSSPLPEDIIKMKYDTLSLKLDNVLENEAKYTRIFDKIFSQKICKTRSLEKMFIFQNIPMNDGPILGKNACQSFADFLQFSGESVQ